MPCKTCSCHDAPASCDKVDWVCIDCGCNLEQEVKDLFVRKAKEAEERLKIETNYRIMEDGRRSTMHKKVTDGGRGKDKVA